MFEGYWYLTLGAGVSIGVTLVLAYRWFFVRPPKGDRSKPYEHHPWDE